MMKKAPFRRQYIVNPKFQYTFMGVMLLLAVITITAFYISQHIFFSQFDQVAMKLRYAADHPFREFLNHQRSTLKDLFIVSAIVNFIAIVAIGAFMSNRIAGPVYRICKTLAEIKQSGTIKEITIRKNDFFQELPEAINQVLQDPPQAKTEEDDSTSKTS